MSMTKKPWSINALATEFGLDRRTVALRVGQIRPAGKQKGSPVWHLADVAPVLASKTVPAKAKLPPQHFSAPPGFQALDDLSNPVDKGAAYMALALVYRVEPVAASLAIGCGAPCEVAYAMAKAMTFALMHGATEIGRFSELEPWASNPDPDIWDLEAFEKVDWPNLAKAAGEPVDLEAWEAFANLRLNKEEAA
ncbi:MAG: hypothetical protein E5W15_24310 [Mesorhizobium sp.]|uniref:hypothetical protein n=1 Tax=unclassified Mesorhizobium TaxID=325217 RepID=UPI000FC9F048|nr:MULTISPECIES: hypothetical protein [unclassified Mesorhizobium]RUW42989.1 hypothetical protein EOA37_02215 [Mesorhizobium sp. M2A.F.Ca.ET.015.02.1.1]RVC93876.1 hypothetical protein EN739_19585 [Mesorhizobium sp. M2A.F.Ca.ET.017.03.2.1]RVD02559.1 hypothetical protein EN753_22655 [Mesorhizobium sp. M2A.F.Ca.ET.029.05.1.1]RWB47577.1 MAG: hypothetical protein EOQ46_05965 [Mesorhizobium sp.]RWB62091.1 MAG: hypothetical protein EOQ48_11730 [Mesorhizobium sp.]